MSKKWCIKHTFCWWRVELTFLIKVCKVRETTYSVSCLHIIKSDFIQIVMKRTTGQFNCFEIISAIPLIHKFTALNTWATVEPLKVLVLIQQPAYFIWGLRVKYIIFVYCSSQGSCHLLSARHWNCEESWRVDNWPAAVVIFTVELWPVTGHYKRKKDLTLQLCIYKTIHRTLFQSNNTTIRNRGKLTWTWHESPPSCLLILICVCHMLFIMISGFSSTVVCVIFFFF